MHKQNVDCFDGTTVDFEFQNVGAEYRVNQKRTGDDYDIAASIEYKPGW